MGNSGSSANGNRNRESGSASVSGSATPVTATATTAGGANSPSRVGLSASNSSAANNAGSTSNSTSASASRSPAAIEAEAASAVAAIAAAASIPTLYPQDARVDNGHLVPLSNIYPTSPQDWIHDTVQRLIVERKLAPFYRGLEDWDEDGFDRDQVDKELDSVGDERSIQWRTKKYSKQERLEEAAMYKKTSECPICFLYYPPLINTSRCCDQPICTECFVQIKRADPTTTNMVSEPSACPYCVEPNFGVTYVSPVPSRRTGLGAPKSANTSKASKGTTSNSTPTAPELTRSSSSNSASSDHEMGPAASAHARRKSVSHTASEVVTVDSIQADWEAKLAAVRATAARRAARRVVFRQVGDRLVPVGISSGRELNPATTMVDDQGRIILTGPVPLIGQSTGYGRENDPRDSFGGALVEGGSSRLLSRGRRSRGFSHGQQSGAGGGTSDIDPRLLGGLDIEEMMLAEAMRLSMADEEERQKKADKEAKAAAKKEKKESKESTSTPVGAAKKLFGKSSGSSSNLAGEGGSSSKAGSLSSARASPRVSMDTGSASGQPSASTSTSHAPTPSTSNQTSPTSPSTSTFPTTAVQSNNPYNSRIGGSTKSSFLRMPPMQRNDSSASMTMHNLPAPLVPSTATGPVARQSAQQNPPRISLQDLEDNDNSLI